MSDDRCSDTWHSESQGLNPCFSWAHLPPEITNHQNRTERPSEMANGTHFSLCIMCLLTLGRQESLLLNSQTLLNRCGLVGWVLSCKVKGHQFDSQSEHMLGLQVGSLVGVCMEGNQSMFLSHIIVSLSLFFPPSLSLKINKIF